MPNPSRKKDRNAYVKSAFTTGTFKKTYCL